MSEARSFTPRTSIGWVGVGLGLGLPLWLVLSYFVSNEVTNGGSEAVPVWVAVGLKLMVLAVAVPAAVVGFRARRTDASVLGTAAMFFASVITGWFAFTGIVGLFFE